jgi:hypothetical protein
MTEVASVFHQGHFGDFDTCMAISLFDETIHLLPKLLHGSRGRLGK